MSVEYSNLTVASTYFKLYLGSHTAMALLQAVSSDVYITNMTCITSLEPGNGANTPPVVYAKRGCNLVLENSEIIVPVSVLLDNMAAIYLDDTCGMVVRNTIAKSIKGPEPSLTEESRFDYVWCLSYLNYNNSRVKPSDWPYLGYIFVVSSSKLDIQNCTFQCISEIFFVTNGGELSVSSSVFAPTHNIFVLNNGAQLAVHSSTFDYSYAILNGSNHVKVSFSTCTFTRSPNIGRQLVLRSGSVLSIENSTMSLNQLLDYPMIQASYVSRVLIRNTNVVGNGFATGFITADSASVLTLESCLYVNNSALNWGVGHFSVADTSNLTVTNSVFRHNLGGNSLVLMNSGYIMLRGTNVSNNVDLSDTDLLQWNLIGSRSRTSGSELSQTMSLLHDKQEFSIIDLHQSNLNIHNCTLSSIKIQGTAYDTGLYHVSVHNSILYSTSFELAEVEDINIDRSVFKESKIDLNRFQNLRIANTGFRTNDKYGYSIRFPTYYPFEKESTDFKTFEIEFKKGNLSVKSNETGFMERAEQLGFLSADEGRFPRHNETAFASSKHVPYIEKRSTRMANSVGFRKECPNV